ncbi:LppU/SCO3897 family protein [Micromonospora sp. IBHARD004]|uniref:LppU/SCO3897 family protein n=1 Tax=Micromonospora sp. IBHARD004 TaxID=3457764 RepID=UPI0040588A9E
MLTPPPKAGDCVAELPRVAGSRAESVDDATIVPCAGARAAYAVVGRVDDPAAARSRSAAGCEPHFRPGDDGYVLYRVGGDGDGYLLCLVRKTNGR